MPVVLQVNDETALELAGVDPVALVERAARAALDAEGVTAGELSLTLLDDAGMAGMNERWLGRQGPTDVVAFSLHGDDEPVLGDVYLGVERAAEQAAELGQSVARELARLAVHGTLHVLGWDHPTEEREQSEMWGYQERILTGVGVE